MSKTDSEILRGLAELIDSWPAAHLSFNLNVQFFGLDPHEATGTEIQDNLRRIAEVYKLERKPPSDEEIELRAALYSIDRDKRVFSEGARWMQSVLTGIDGIKK